MMARDLDSFGFLFFDVALGIVKINHVLGNSNKQTTRRISFGDNPLAEIVAFWTTGKKKTTATSQITNTLSFCKPWI